MVAEESGAVKPGAVSEADEPLYTREEAARVKQYRMPTPYDQVFEVAPGITASLINAGHILGSAAVRLDIEEKGSKRQRIWFSGDIGRRNLPLIRDPILPNDVDTLINGKHLR